MENIMLDAKHKNIKIVDFGLSNTYDSDQRLQTHCGSAEYAAPELFISGQNYGPEVDIWSILLLDRKAAIPTIHLHSASQMTESPGEISECPTPRGICMFTMLTGHLPFTTPHSENRRLHLLHQIQFGLGPRHDSDLQHLSADGQELLRACIESNPELRIPLLDIELHPWLTNQDKELFKPYRQLPKDNDASSNVIQKMSEYLKLPAQQISQCVHDYRLDEYSALYNILLDDLLKKKGSFDGDHTLRKPIIHHTLVKAPPNPNDNEIDNTNRDFQVTSRPKTPAVVGLVKYNNHVSTKQPIDRLDFELAVLKKNCTETHSRRPRTAICPPTGIKTKPIGNATTVNNVIARNYNNKNDKKYQRPRTTATCQPSKTPTRAHEGHSENTRKQIWQHSTATTRDTTIKSTKRTQKKCPKPQATLAMLAAVDIADEHKKNAIAVQPEIESSTTVVNEENATPSILTPTFTNQLRITPSDAVNTKSVQFSKDAKLPNEAIRSKEISVIYMNKTFKHGYQLSRTATMYDQSENVSHVQFNEFKPKLVIKLKESRASSSNREASVDDFDREFSSSRSSSSTPSTSSNKISRPPTRLPVQAPTMSEKPGSDVMAYVCSNHKHHVPVTTPNSLQSPMPQRICWKKKGESVKDRQQKDENRIQIMASRNNVHQTIPERDIRVVSSNFHTSNSPRRTVLIQHPPPRRSKMLKKYAVEHNSKSCSSVACNECHKEEQYNPDFKMFQLLRDASPCSCGGTASMCFHNQESLHLQVDRMKRCYRDQLSSKKKAPSSPKIIPKQAVNMLRNQSLAKATDSIQTQSRPRLKYAQADLVTIVTKPPTLKTDERKKTFEIERTQVETYKDKTNHGGTKLNNQTPKVGFALERKISNAYKEGHVISKMRRTPDSFALIYDL